MIDGSQLGDLHMLAVCVYMCVKIHTMLSVFVE